MQHVAGHDKALAGVYSNGLYYFFKVFFFENKLKYFLKFFFLILEYNNS